MDYYELMGVPRNATVTEITTVYREMAKKYHPDLHPGDAECVKKFKEIALAFETLTDMNKRAMYNARNPEKPKPKPKPAPKKRSTEKWIKVDGEFKLNPHFFERNDPNWGNIIDVPPSKYDIWGQPIRNDVDGMGFKDSVRYYEGGSQPDIR